MMHWGPWGPFLSFLDTISEDRKITKKIPESTDQYFRSVLHFFKRPKLCQNEAEPTSKKYGESPWFFLYILAGERGTLIVWSFEIGRGQTWPKPKINLGLKITNLNEILSFWSKFWDFGKNFAKKNSQKYRPVFQIGIPFFQKGKTPSKQSRTSLKKIWLDLLIFSLQV